MEFESINTADSLSLYRKFFPHFVPNIYQQELIEVYVTDMAVWLEVLELWAGNDYRPQSVKKMIDCYTEKVNARVPQSYNHVNKQPTQREAIEAELRMVAEMEKQ